MPARSRHRHAFSLIELVVVLVILAAIATIAMPRVSRASAASRQTAFVETMRRFGTAVELVQTQSQAWPTEAGRGIVPTELSDYIAASDWARPTPLGGNWDYDVNAAATTAAIAVKGPGLKEADMLSVDRIIDDGDLTKGRFQKVNDGIYLHILSVQLGAVPKANGGSVEAVVETVLDNAAATLDIIGR